MHCELSPAIQDWIAALQKCRQKKNLEQAKSLHVHLCTLQLESHPVLCNYLVPVLVECGSLHDARQVFDSLPINHWNHYSWNGLISGYMGCGEPQHAFQLYDKMQEGNCCVQPDTVTYLTMVAACARLKEVERGHGIHTKVIQRGLEKDGFLGNTLVEMYGKCSSLAEAQQVFDGLPFRDAVSWNALITGYTDQGLGDRVGDCIQKMLLEGVCPHLSTLICGLKACGSGGRLGIGQEVYIDMVKRGYEKELFVGSTLLDMYGKCGLLAEARLVFDGLPIRDVVSWAALVAGYTEHGLGEEARDCFYKMLLEGLSPDSVTLICTLKACGAIRDLETGRLIHTETTKRALESDLHLGNMLVDLYGKCNAITEARQVFCMLSVRDVVSWNSLISGCADYEPIEDIEKWFEEMLLEGITPQSVTYVCSLKACGSVKALETGKALHGDTVLKGMEKESHVRIALVALYTECGALAEAHRVFDGLLARSRILWNALIAGYAEHGLGEEARSCLQLMVLEGISPDSITFSCILKACDGIGAAEACLEAHFEASKRGLEKDVYVGSTLVDVYTECGLLAEALLVFNELPVQNSVSWNALLSGYLEHGHSDEAKDCFQRMRLQGTPPDALTFVCNLKACSIAQAVEMGRESHAGLVKRGLESEYYVSSTLVYMYTECGSYEEAWKVFDDLPVRNTASWNTLIGGYAEQGLSEKACNCFQKMLQEGVSPDCVTFVCGLKACGLCQSLVGGRELHAEVTKSGLERDLFVGSALVNMYVECGSHMEAHKVFKELPIRNTGAWNAMIGGYAEHDLSEEALNSLQEMWVERVSPDAVTFVCVLKACGVLHNVEIGREIHSETVKRGFERELYVGSTLVDMYTACSSLIEAVQVFGGLPARNAVSWNALIAGYAESGLDEEASNCFQQILLEGLSPDSITFVCSLKSCGLLGNLESGRGLHAETIKRGLEGELQVGSTAVDMYIDCGSLDEAQQVFDRLLMRDTGSWNALILGYTEHGLCERAGNLFHQMLSEGISPSIMTFACCLKACGAVRALQAGQEVHADMVKRDWEREPHVGNMLVDMYVRCDMIDEARQVFDWLPVQSAVSWDALLGGLTDHGLGEEVKECFEQMQMDGVSPDSITFISCLKSCGTIKALEMGKHLHAEIIKKGLERDLYIGSSLVDMYINCCSLPEGRQVFDKLGVRNAVSWNALISGLAEHGLGAEAGYLWNQMLEEGISPSCITFVCCLKACGTIQDFELCCQIHAELAKRKLEGNLQAGSMLVNAYIECGFLAEARQVFSKMPVRNIVSWNALIAGYAEHGLCEEAWSSLRQMQLEGISPGTVTFVCSLKACGNMGALEMGREIHAEITKRGLETKSQVGSMLVDIYGNCSSLAEARRMFEMLSAQSVVLWTAMIKAYGNNHEGHMAVQCFEDMQEQGVKPSSVTFICLLGACSHSSLVLKGQEYFKLMREHGIEPMLDHYACMVDLFARSGHVHEAEKFFVAMHCAPSSAMLRGMLSACKNYGKVELGKWCFQQLVEGNQVDSSAYLLMADVYGGAGRLSDASRLEEMRRGTGLKKKPGNASIEVNKKLHEFAVGVTQSKLVLEMFEILRVHMKGEDYVPNLGLLSSHILEYDERVLE